MPALFIHFLLIIGFPVSAQLLGDYSATLRIGEQTFATEIADTQQKMQTGMMHRHTMADNQAMLFVFSSPRKANFWMKNTLISLDMLFFNAAGELLEIKSQVPPCKTPVCPNYASNSSAIQFVVELKGGTAAKKAIRPGQTMAVLAR